MMTVPGGRTYGGEHPAFEQEEVVASCAQSESCDGANTSAWPPTRGAPHDGVRCHVQPVCVPDASVTTSSSMCSVGHGGNGHASLALLAIGLVALAARRRAKG
jgi:MYXO-CTERM domain-containing protein